MKTQLSCAVLCSCHTRTVTQQERLYNPRLTKPLNEFKDIMANLNLPKPKKIDIAVPANLQCGVYETGNADDSSDDVQDKSKPQS